MYKICEISYITIFRSLYIKGEINVFFSFFRLKFNNFVKVVFIHSKI
jgi:hypothetical protein